MKHFVLATLLSLLPALALAQEVSDARSIVKGAIDHWRGVSSVAEMTMVIHRPDWERTMSMRAWTKGEKKSLVRVLAPKKDRGNGTLTDDNNLWSYSPRVNRVIKVPSSMMGQSWMGSDFSNKDIAKSDEIVDEYSHTLLSTEEVDGITVYEIESVPHEDAAVVWGREVLRVRDDYVLLSHSFFDQDGELVKKLETLAVATMGGRTIAQRQRMHEIETPDEYTEVSVDTVEYDVELSDSLFTLSNLRNPRD